MTTENTEKQEYISRFSGQYDSMRTEDDCMLKEEIFYDCIQKKENEKYFCDVVISKYRNTLENYYKGEPLQLVTKEKQYQVPWEKLKKRYKIQDTVDWISPFQSFFGIPRYRTREVTHSREEGFFKEFDDMIFKKK